MRPRTFKLIGRSRIVDASVAYWRIEKFGQTVSYMRVASRCASHVALGRSGKADFCRQSHTAGLLIAVQAAVFWKCGSTKTELLRLVSVVAVGSNRAAFFVSCGIASWCFSCLTRAERLSVFLNDISMVAWSCSMMLDKSMKLQSGDERAKAIVQRLS